MEGSSATPRGGGSLKKNVPEPAISVGCIMHHTRYGRRETQIRPVTICADIISEAFAMIAEAQLIIGPVEASGINGEIAFAIAFESAAGHHIQYAVGTVACIGAQPSA